MELEWYYQLIWTAVLALIVTGAFIVWTTQESFEYKVSRMIDKVADEPATVAAFGRTLQNVLNDENVQKSTTVFVESVIYQSLVNVKKSSEIRRKIASHDRIIRAAPGGCRHVDGTHDDSICDYGSSCDLDEPLLGVDKKKHDIVNASADVIDEMFLLLKEPVLDVARKVAVSDQTNKVMIEALEKFVGNKRLEDEFVRLIMRIAQRPEVSDLMADNIQSVSKNLVSKATTNLSYFWSGSRSANKSADALTTAVPVPSAPADPSHGETSEPLAE